MENPGSFNQFNAWLQFIRPSHPSDCGHLTQYKLPLGTNSLGISFDGDDTNLVGTQQHDELGFHELNYPHVKHAGPVSIITHRRTSEGGILPLLSSSPSPTSSCSVNTSPLLRSSSRRDIPRTKCKLTRRSSTASPQVISVSANSWSHLKSPAASFLAGFASISDPQSPLVAEEAGDEIDDYVLDKVIGCGGFSTVRLGYSLSDGSKVAVKIIRRVDLSEAARRRLEVELDIWQSLDHPNVVRIHKVLETDAAIYVVCEYCPHSLLDRVNAKPLLEHEVHQIFVQLGYTLAYLHDVCKVTHKDLKLENILLDQDGHVKLCDFGLAMYHSFNAHDLSNQDAGGSLAYVAPEQIQTSKPLTCPKTDVWSLGVILYTLIAGFLPFLDNFDLRLQRKILTGDYAMPRHASPDLQQLIYHCLKVNPNERYSLDDVLASPWFTRSAQ